MTIRSPGDIAIAALCTERCGAVLVDFVLPQCVWVVRHGDRRYTVPLDDPNDDAWREMLRSIHAGRRPDTR